MVINDFPDDDFFLKGRRLQLVKQLEYEGITDRRVLSVMKKLPRHFFVNPMYIEHAYDNKPLPIGREQTISQPFTVAFQTQLLNIHAGDKVLEVGTGSGYQAAVLLEMGAKVYTIERHKTLYEETKRRMKSLGYKAHLFYGDGYEGLPFYAPFDKILITAAAPEVPEKLLGQLTVGGIMVVPLNNNSSQVMTTFKKINTTDFEVKKHGRFSFVPMLKGKDK